MSGWLVVIHFNLTELGSHYESTCWNKTSPSPPSDCETFTPDESRLYDLAARHRSCLLQHVSSTIPVDTFHHRYAVPPHHDHANLVSLCGVHNLLCVVQHQVHELIVATKNPGDVSIRIQLHWKNESQKFHQVTPASFHNNMHALLPHAPTREFTHFLPHLASKARSLTPATSPTVHHSFLSLVTYNTSSFPLKHLPLRCFAHNSCQHAKATYYTYLVYAESVIHIGPAQPSPIP
eukprot:768259-Hanusia_phi.AAC.5